MKKKLVKYTIEEPCHEDWSQMIPEEKGRFCNSCTKTVIDFSNMSDFSIVSYLTERKNESVCGRIRPSQMEKSYISPKSRSSFSFDLKTVALGVALTTFSAIHADAQITTTEQVNTSEVIREPLDGLVSAIEYYDHSDEQFTSGIILLDGKPCRFAEVQLMDEQDKELIKVSVNDKGEFNIPLNWNKTPSHLMISGPGLISGGFFLSDSESITNWKLTVYKDEPLILGRMSSKPH